MALTRITAGERNDRRARLSAASFGTGDLVLAATSLVAAIAIALAYAGRMGTLAWSAAAAATPAVLNLNTVTSTGALEPVLGQVFDTPADAKFAARQLLQFLVSGPEDRQLLPNVGGLLRIQIPVEEIDRDQPLVEYAERLRAARARAFTVERPLPVTVPLLTTADLLKLKPRLGVRTGASFQRALIVWAVLFVAGFHAV